MIDHRRITMLVLAGCIGLYACATPAPPAPINTAPIDVPLEKLVQPAFAADYGDKTVRFEGEYLLTLPTMIDLPAEYREGFVRIDVMQGTTGSTKIIVPKDHADSVFALKQGQRIRITAYALPINTYSGITGASQGELLLIANSVEPVAAPQPPTPQPPAPKRKSKH